MNKSGLWFTLVAVMLAASLSAACPNLAQAQCGGSGDGGNSHMRGNMGSGNMGTMMGSGQGGTYSPAPPVPVPPNSVAPPSNPGPAYTGPAAGAGGQMMGQGGAASDHRGHMGQTN